MHYPLKAFTIGAMLMFDIAFSQYPSNPLNTADQRMLGRLATKLHQQRPCDGLISEASQPFASIATENGYDVSSPALQLTLAQAIDELAFSSIYKAIKDDPAHPRV
jgi:hypothetical protein